MTPLARLRIEKAAADCGFEKTPVFAGNALVLGSTRFPEQIFVTVLAEMAMRLASDTAGILGESAVTLEVDDLDALYDALQRAAATARTWPNRVADRFREQTCTLPRATEAERLVVQRVGQNLFREALLDFWGGRCAVTGLDMPELLRASHIKPWAVCVNDDERLDVFNGLLLAPHLDALFDAGLMTVDNDGLVYISDRVADGVRRSLGLISPLPPLKLRPAHARYLLHHRQCVWRP